MAGETDRQRAAATRRVAVPGIGRRAGLAARSQTRADRGVPQIPGREVTAHDAILRSAARGGADRAGADAAPLSHQASVLDLLRPGVGDAH